MKADEFPKETVGKRFRGGTQDMYSNRRGADQLHPGQVGKTDTQEHDRGRGSTAAAKQPSDHGSAKPGVKSSHDSMAAARKSWARSGVKRMHGE